MKQKFYYLTFLSALLIFYQEMNAQPFGYGYVRELVIDETQIPDGASLSNFPLLVQLTHADLRSTANGGHVENNNGYDILFYLNGCVTKLDHQLENFDPVTGTVTAWVRIPVLSTISNTSVYMYYGNNSVVTSTSTTGVWNSDYSGVWHLTEDPSGPAPQMQDGTSNGRHGTSNGAMTAANSVPGKMGRAISFDEVNDHIRIPDFLYGQELTVSFWFNLGEVNGNSYQYLFSHGAWATQNSLNVYMGEDNITIPAEIPNRQMLKTNFRDSNDANNFDTLNAGNTLVDGNWHYYSIRIQDFGGATVYIDGTAVINYSVWGANSFDPVTDIFLGGREDLHAQRFFGGMLDEARISTVWRSSNWIRTEYNNQQWPATFVTVGPEGPAVSFCAPLSVRLYDFDVYRSGDAVQLNWRLDGQTGSVQYTIERSTDGNTWEKIGHLENKNHFTDTPAPRGILYYRVQYFHSGKTNFSPVHKVSEQDPVTNLIKLYPNPVTGRKIYAILAAAQIPQRISLYDPAGRFIQNLNFSHTEGTVFSAELPAHLQQGIYVLRISCKDRQENHKIVIR